MNVQELTRAAKVHVNLPVPKLIEMAVLRGEGVLTSTGALSVTTGKYTGRSPNDKFIVDTPEIHDLIAWGPVNAPFPEERFERLYHRLLAYLQNRELFVFNGFAGADPEYRLSVQFINEYAWQNAFVHQLFIRPSREELSNFYPEFRVICAPGFKAVPEVDGTNSEAFIILNLTRKMIVIGGTSYAGEMKKSIFTVLNYIMPLKGIASMHCAANVGDKQDVALFFGLSGTGKTSLSADPNRRIIGDDEHGWSNKGIFNFEGGCYAKCIRLSRENEPLIWDAIRFGAILENVVVDPETRVADYDSEALTENTRAGYPVDFIPGAVVPGIGNHPTTIFFLTADAFGVLPPISKLTPEGAMYHFLSGYTSKLAGTERGITEPQATFSTCFGAPFLPLQPMKYAELLAERITRHGTNVYLVNTGWSGGPYGVGQRIKIQYTRAMVTAAINGDLERASYYCDPIFNLMVPEHCPNVPSEILKPRDTWANKDEYDSTAKSLAKRFNHNFSKFTGIPESVIQAGPRIHV